MSVRRTDLVPLLRCVCVLLVLASEIWILQPITHAATVRPLDGVLRAGNLAFAALFALSGFALTRALLPLVQVRRRTALAAGSRLTFAVVPVVLLVSGVVGLASALDSTDPTQAEVTRRSIGHVLSFDWNSYVREHPLGVRTDLVPLWFFSVEAQLLVGLIVLLLLLGRHPRLLTVVLVAGLGASYWWSVRVFDDQGWFQSSLRTDTHIDALLCGVLAAVLTRRPRWSPGAASTVVGSGALGLVGLVLFASRMSLEQSFRGVDVLTALVVAAMLGAGATADGTGKVFDLAGSAPLVGDLGRSWAYVLAFGAPVYAAVNRHTATWDDVTRFLAAAALLALVAYVVDQVLRPLALTARETVRSARRRTTDASGREVAEVDRGAGRQ